MFTLKHELETLLIIVFASFVGIFFVFQNHHKKQLSVATSMPEFLKSVAAPISITPTPVIQTASEISSDGTMQITMKTESNRNFTNTYSFSVSLKSDNNQSQLIFSKTVDAGTSFSIPFNTFSPQNKYLFLKQDDKDKTRYLVFNSSGKPFADGQEYLDITPLFEKHSPDLTLKNVTGWASETLLILQTSGPSFWFEIPSHFIQLSTKF